MNPSPTQEELEAAKRRKKAELEEQLKRANDALKALERKKDEELDEAADARRKKKMKEMEGETKTTKAENERIAGREKRNRRKPTTEGLEEDEAIWPSKDQVKLKKALKRRKKSVAAEKNYMEVEEARGSAEGFARGRAEGTDAAKGASARHARDAKNARCNSCLG